MDHDWRSKLLDTPAMGMGIVVVHLALLMLLSFFDRIADRLGVIIFVFVLLMIAIFFLERATILRFPDAWRARRAFPDTRIVGTTRARVPFDLLFAGPAVSRGVAGRSQAILSSRRARQGCGQDRRARRRNSLNRPHIRFKRGCRPPGGQPSG